MTHSTLNERLRVYLKTSAKCIVGLVLAFLTGGLIAFVNIRAGVGIILLSPLFYFGFFHWSIAKRITPKDKAPALYGLPVFIASFLLLSYKVVVNETINLSCLDRIPEWVRLLNYIGYSLWTGILFWEVYLLLIMKRSLSIR